jgi:ABC-2 type transport system permease protein
LRRWSGLLKGFVNILVKELKELIRDPKVLLGMIVFPLILFPVMGSIMGYSIQSAQEQAANTPLLIVNNDGGYWSERLIEIFSNSSPKVFVVNDTIINRTSASELLSEYNTTQFIVIPEGFSANMTAHEVNPTVKATISFYGVFSGGSIFESAGSKIIDNLVYVFNRNVAPDAVYSEKSTIVKGEIYTNVDPAVLSNVMISQAIAMPIIIIILLSYSMTIAATSVAMEKEEKTLETLLTLPMDRFAILMGKLSGSILIAAVGALAYMVGFNYYIGGITSTIPAGANVNLADLGLVPSVFGYLLLGISLFVTILSALALAVIISAFAEDVRSAQSLVGYVYPFLFVPAIALMYLDINSVPLALKVVLYAIPYTQPIIASKAVIMGDYWTAVLGIIYVTAFTLAVMYGASRLFATEKILTAKLKLRGLRKRRKTSAEEFQ